jgi:hypothetical protein
MEKTLSQQFGLDVEVSSLHKTGIGEWSLMVNRKLVLLSTADLIRQYKFRYRCVEQISVLPGKITNKKWIELVRELINLK